MNALFPNSVQMFGIDKMNESWDLRQKPLHFFDSFECVGKKTQYITVAESCSMYLFWPNKCIKMACK